MVVDGNTSTMNRRWESSISYLSQTETLLPGEVLGSGTVGFGCFDGTHYGCFRSKIAAHCVQNDLQRCHLFL